MTAFDEEAIETARKTFAGPVAFLKSAPALQHLPDPDVPEVAFAGRSNVGKSSLLNALAGRNGLARTSNTPGRTQELNFFDVGDPLAFRLVDMPGYGFAKAPKDVVRKWRFLVNDFLRGRQALKRALVLIDARHGIKDVDREILEMLDNAAVSYGVYLTKAYNTSAAARPEDTPPTDPGARTPPAAHPDLLVTSAEKGLGIPELRAAVLEAIG